MNPTYTAVVQQHGDWWIGWVDEVPGVNSQGKTREELLDNLRDALDEALTLTGVLFAQDSWAAQITLAVAASFPETVTALDGTPDPHN